MCNHNYIIIAPMKIKIILSILFLIFTTFSTIHELEHIGHDSDSSCLICHVHDNLVSADDINKIKDTQAFYFEKISYNKQISNIHTKKQTNQDRAPPLAS